MNDNEKKDEIVLDEKDIKIQELESQLNGLNGAYESLNSSFNSILNMLRFTVGIAYNAHPDNDKIKAMVDKLFTVEGE